MKTLLLGAAVVSAAALLTWPRSEPKPPPAPPAQKAQWVEDYNALIDRMMAGTPEENCEL